MPSRAIGSSSTSIFVPQSLETPLSNKALQDLAGLKSSHHANNNKLREHLANAIKLLGDTATQLNDRGTQERQRYANKKRRLAADDLTVSQDHNEQYEEMQERVNSTTQRFDQGVRQIIDDRIWLDNVPDAMTHIINKSNTASSRATNRPQNGMDEGDEQDTAAAVQPDSSENPTALLHAAMSTFETSWKSKTLTERYAQDNDYTGYYRAVYDAKNPEENAPPMPHYRLWFATEEGRGMKSAPRGSQRQPDQSQNTNNDLSSTQVMIDLQSNSDDDVEIQSEKIRLTCPITLKPFTDPVRSAKCPHAYEKAAIFDILRVSTESLPLTSSQNDELLTLNGRERNRREKEMRVPSVRCPECLIPLTAKDLQPDPVLLRKVKRMLEKQRKEAEAERRDQNSNTVDAEEEDSDDDDAPPRGTQRRNIVSVTSSPTSRSAKRNLKEERRQMSMIPQTQYSSGDVDRSDAEMDE